MTEVCMAVAPESVAWAVAVLVAATLNPWRRRGVLMNALSLGSLACAMAVAALTGMILLSSAGVVETGGERQAGQCQRIVRL